MADSKEKKRYFFKNLGMFGLATLIPKILTFLMLPLYTACLSREEYGMADLLNNTYSLLAPFLTIQVQDAVMRFSLLGHEKKEDVLSIGVLIVAIGGVLLSVVCACLHRSGLLAVPPGFLLFLCVLYFGNVFQNIFAYFCRGINRVDVIATVSILHGITVVGCNLLFLLHFHWGLYGYWMASALGVLLADFFYVFRVGIFRFLAAGRVSRALLRKMVLFSVPMLFSAISWWVNNASDKYILTFYNGVSAVGLYAVSSKIPSVLSAFGAIVSQTFSISAIKEFNPDDSDGFLGDIYSAVSFFSFFICSLLILCNIPLAKILFSESFFPAWQYAPPLLIAAAFNQVSMSCQNILMGIGETGIIFRTSLIGALVNTTLNFTLIPSYGTYGAAVATVVGFFVVWILRYIEVGKYVRLKHHFIKEVASYALATLQMITAFYGNRFVFFQICLCLCIVLLFKNMIRVYTRTAFVSATKLWHSFKK